MPPSGERRPSLGLLALPVLVLDVVCAFGVAAANHGTARSVLLAILGLCLVATLVVLTMGPRLIRGATDVPTDAYRPTAPIRSTPVLILPDTPVPVPGPFAPAAHSAPAALAPTSELILAAAQRHQALVQRQRTVVAGLSGLAGAEKDTLEQLTERMRRHGDSLMVIAGVEPERPVRGPMALSEVIASAAAAIESSERVSWSLAVDQFVQPQLAPPLVHLLAELLDNATGYAFPAGGVQVFVQPSVDGVRLRIEDSGPGFSDHDLDRANQRLRDPEADGEEIGSLGYGLFVAGRLAQDVPCSVEMTRAESGGVSVLVDLPRSVFGTAPEVARSEDYSHYDDATDLPEYAEMQGYADIPTSNPLPGEPTPVAEPVTSPWQSPVAPAANAWSTEPAVVPDPVASAGQMSLAEPFGANAPLPVALEEKQPEERIAMPQTFFNPIAPKTPAPEAEDGVAQVEAAEPSPSADVSWNPSWGTDVGSQTRWDVGPSEEPSLDARWSVGSESPWDGQGNTGETSSFDAPVGRDLDSEARDDVGGSWAPLTGAGTDPALDPLARVLAEQSRAAESSSWADARTDALSDPLTDPLTGSPYGSGPVSWADHPTEPVEEFSDPISHPPHPEHAAEHMAASEGAASEGAVVPSAPSVPKQYPSRAELRRQRRAREAGSETAMQAGAQAAAQVAAAQATGPGEPAPAAVHPGGAERETAEDWAAAARAEDRNILGPADEREAAERYDEGWVAPSAGAPGVPHQVSPLDDPNFRFPDEPVHPAYPSYSGDSAESPVIPAQAEAPEDGPQYPEPAEADPAPPRHAASGPIPMVSASRSHLAGADEAPRQRATQVRSMLSGLRSGAEKARRESADTTESDAGVPRPRHSDQPGQ